MRNRLGQASLGLGLAAGLWAVIAVWIAFAMPRDVPAGLFVAIFHLTSLLGLTVGIVALVGATRQGRELPTVAVIGTYVSGMTFIVASVILALFLLHA